MSLWGVLLLCGCAEVMDVALRTDVDSDCVAAINHIKDCDERYVGTWASCTRTRGSTYSQPDINASQSRCVRETSCFTVRAAVSRGDFLCGISLVARAGSGDRPAQEARKPFKPDERND